MSNRFLAETQTKRCTAGEFSRNISPAIPREGRGTSLRFQYVSSVIKGIYALNQNRKYKLSYV